jgi:isopentenyl phosphate kinase
VNPLPGTSVAGSREPSRSGPSVVKFGGAVITRKHRDAQLRPKVLARLAEEIAGADHPVVLLHGAGSFGHPAARRFGLSHSPEAAPTVQQRTRGAAIVSAEVRRLHGAVLRAVLQAGGRPWSVPPASVAGQDAGRLVRMDERPVRWALDRGLTPVSFGDVVPDDAWGVSILSADTIAVELAHRLHARRVIFVSDVEGVYVSTPGGARSVAPRVTALVVQSLGPTAAGPDVTGGIRGKAEAMLRVAENGCDAALISGLKDGALSRALRGEPVFGSWAKAGADQAV